MYNFLIQFLEFPPPIPACQAPPIILRAHKGGGGTKVNFSMKLEIGVILVACIWNLYSIRHLLKTFTYSFFYLFFTLCSVLPEV